MTPRDRPRTVYSSEHGTVCPHCGLPSRRCQCRANPRGDAGLTNPQSDGVVRVGRTNRGRGGKTVTLLEGVQLPAAALRELARELRRQCGTGGRSRTTPSKFKAINATPWWSGSKHAVFESSAREADANVPAREPA